MSTETKQQVLARLRRRYATAGREHKAKLLDQAVELLGDHRKAAIRALGAAPPPDPRTRRTAAASRRGTGQPGGDGRSN